MSSLVLSSSAQLPSELDYQTTLAAAGYAAGFVERCPLRDASVCLASVRLPQRPS